MGSVIDGMGTTLEYDWTSFFLSLSAMALASIYAYRVVRSYRIYHDERAAVNLAKAIGLLVISLGLLVSSIGLLIESPMLAIAGLSLSRGAFLVLLATLVLADVRPKGER